MNGIFRLLSASAVFLAICPATAGEINFELRNIENAPLAGTVLMKKGRDGEEVRSDTVPQTGNKLVSNISCDDSRIVITAISFNRAYFLDSEENWKNCVFGPIRFRFRRSEYANLIEGLLQSNPAVISVASLKVKQLHADMITAINAGNFSTASKNSLLLYDEVKKELGPAAAVPFQILTLDIAGSTLAAPTGKPPLEFSTQQNKFVVSPETTVQIRKFREAKVLEDGVALDWKTIGKLPQYGQ